MSIQVSVVVPTYQRPRLLERCLQALLDQHFDPSAYEIIVVDDGNDPVTRQLVANYQNQLPSRLEMRPQPEPARLDTPWSRRAAAADHPPGGAASFRACVTTVPRLVYLPARRTHGPAAARNLGWRQANGRIIAFTDDDCLPAPSWLSEGTAAFRGEIAAVNGRVVVPLPAHPTDHARNTTGLEHSLFVTANCFYRKDVLASLGGFDERFPAAWREDSDLFFTLRERGYRWVNAPDAVVVHPVRPVPWGSSLHHQRKSLYNALLFKKHPDLYRQIIQPSPPWRYYGMLGALLAALLGLLRAKPLLALLGFFTWLGLLARFIQRRLENTSHAPRHVLEMIVTSLFIPPLSIYWRLRGAIKYRVFFL